MQKADVKNALNGNNFEDYITPYTLGIVISKKITCPCPVGFCMISTVATDPSTLYPGTTWTLLADKFILGAGSKYALGSTGGEEKHQLTVAELASHNHGQQVTLDTSTGAGNIRATVVGGGGIWSTYDTNQIQYAGSNQPHNNMPPYRAFNIWLRTQ